MQTTSQIPNKASGWPPRSLQLYEIRSITHHIVSGRQIMGRAMGLLLLLAANTVAQSGEPFEAFFARVDADNDGILDTTEMEVR